jgi:lipid II:glycine glycyltransferase (peptidoglycan interpeptide bridge formation enzyme)
LSASRCELKMTEYKVEIDRVTEPGWPDLLDQFADANIYQTWAYGSIRWGSRNLSHLVLKRNEEPLGLAQLRIIRPAGLRMGVAYLRWGPLCELRGKDFDLQVLEILANELREEYCRKRGLYLEILPNAFAGSPRAQAFQLAFSGYDCTHQLNSENYRTLVVDLTPPLEELRKKLDRKWRNQLTGAEKNNLNIVAGTSAELYKSFSELYVQMWERKKFKTTVSIEEFGRIQQSLPENQRMRVILCLQEGKPVAGVVCSAIGNSAIYLLGATNEQGMKLKAAYLLHWTLMQWLKEKGVHYYDLGGIDPEANPGVYHFKSGFSGEDLSHINSLTTCDSKMSMALVKTGHALREGWKSFQSRHGQT